MKIVLAQLNLCVGDIKGNIKKMIDSGKEARDQLHADVIVFPELSITGYPPEDLLFRDSFLKASDDALSLIKEQLRDIHYVIGYPKKSAHGLQNVSAVIYNGQTLGESVKINLPNYGVFDECRYFIKGQQPCVVTIKDIPVGIIICEDIWNEEPILAAVKAKARIILSPNASPFEINKHEERHQVLKKRALSANVPIVYVNQVGGQDELVFDGGSMVVNEKGEICEFAGFNQEKLLLVDVQHLQAKNIHFDKDKCIYDALVLSTRDYVQKNKFPGVLIGVSGGIDSALVLAIACDALGKDKVKALILPSRYTSQLSLDDGKELIQNFNVTSETIDIEPIFSSFLSALAPSFKDQKPDITEENLQARARGTLMMAHSNKFGYLVLTTGNRSEMAVGYATLYGDMAGGLAVLKDIPKTLVYRLCHYRNKIKNVIPESILKKAPTAELNHNQKDEDSLPPYSILDQILEYYLDKEWCIEEIVEKGFERAVVIQVVNLIKKSEYKRRQAPIGIRINHIAFGRDRRYPITSGFFG